VSLFSRLFGQKAQSWRWISPVELQAQLAKPSPPRLVDVRSPDEFRGPDGHVRGAENQPMQNLLAQSQGLLNDQRPIVLICLSQIRSSKAADALSAAGVKTLSVVRGGMQAWRAAGFPTEQ
jgi:rhodanese-related sulfurtransferase